QPGHIYIAPPDHHLLLKQGYIRVTRGPKENGHRPAVDPTFRSAARTYGKRVIGVVLSGALDDGTLGLTAVKMRHGLAVVQDPEDAMYTGMPLSAIENVQPDYVLPVSKIAPLLVQLAYEPVPNEHNSTTPTPPDEIAEEVEIAEMTNTDPPSGTPSTLACPDCGGTLWELQEGELIRFRCRVGHAFTAQSLLVRKSDQ